LAEQQEERNGALIVEEGIDDDMPFVEGIDDPFGMGYFGFFVPHSNPGVR
jgi:hypothetical protein